jgi:hypothetical protein
MLLGTARFQFLQRSESGSVPLSLPIKRLLAALSPGVNQLERVANVLAQSSVAVKKSWTYISTAQDVFTL